MSTEKVDTKENEITASGSSEYLNTALIDVVRKLSPYIPQHRVAKWSAILAKEDLDYLIDLMVLPQNALIHSRFSVRLYGELLRIKNLPIVEVKVISTQKNNIAIEARKQFEACYIDRGDKLNNSKVFVQVSGDGGMGDLKQKIIYCGTDNRLRFYFVRNSQRGHYMMISTETKDTHFEQLRWTYRDEKEQKNVSIKLQIRSWNM